jgi:transposase
MEDANIKLASVVSKIDGVSSMNMIRALMKKDKLSKEEISNMARGKLKNEVDQLAEAPNGKVTEHHRFLLRLRLNDIAFLAEQVQKIDEQIKKAMIPYQKENTLIQTIQGISKTAALAIIAEIGVNMSQFPSDAHLACWAGICPGNN